MLSQEELAEIAGISTTHMSHIETGNTKLSLSVIADIAAALRVSVDDLLYDSPNLVDNCAEIALNRLLIDATAKERKIILDIVRATIESLRNNN